MDWWGRWQKSIRSGKIRLVDVEADKALPASEILFAGRPIVVRIAWVCRDGDWYQHQLIRDADPSFLGRNLVVPDRRCVCHHPAAVAKLARLSATTWFALIRHRSSGSAARAKDEAIQAKLEPIGGARNAPAIISVADATDRDGPACAPAAEVSATLWAESMASCTARWCFRSEGLARDR